MIKECKIHGFTEFSDTAKRSRCNQCCIDAVQRRRVKVKQLALDYKGGKCSNCGYNKCDEALEFHHIDPSKKDFTIAGNGYCNNWEKVKAELDKCLLLCANCHREIHASKAFNG